MNTRALGDADRERLRNERAEADRRYNDALTALDALVGAEPPSLPPPVAPPDEALVAPINERWRILPSAPDLGAGWRGRLGRLVWRIVGPIVDRQQTFNAALVEHLNRNIEGERRARETLNGTLTGLDAELASAVRFQSRLVQYLQQITAYVDTKDRESMAAMLADPHEQIRRVETALGLMQQQVAALKREFERSASVQPGEDAARGPDRAGQPGQSAAAHHHESVNAYRYVGFEAQFRGSEREIAARLAAYASLFAGAREVLDVGCGRGELLERLRADGIEARGVELNHEMAEVCRERGLRVEEADAVSFLERLPDAALGGLFAAQVVEHLEPAYLTRFLDLAYRKLRPGSKIVLETINVDCWSAFFGPYLRDVTHVRPLPSATLRFLLEASGFQRIEIRASAPVPERDKLQPLTARVDLPADVRPLADAFNASVERLNGLLFTHLDYAAIGEKV
ncbi:MAG: class I SAM-dependent methyltransferase [Betaproteobacteria bacterium]